MCPPLQTADLGRRDPDGDARLSAGGRRGEKVEVRYERKLSLFVLKTLKWLDFFFNWENVKSKVRKTTKTDELKEV